MAQVQASSGSKVFVKWCLSC